MSQTRAVGLEFTNTSTSTCVLKGYPSVVATEPGRHSVVATNDGAYQFSDDANIAPGERAELIMNSYAACNANPGGSSTNAVYSHVTITLPGSGSISLTLPQRLDLGCGLHTTTFMVPRPLAAPPPDPFAALTAAVELPDRAALGSVLIYFVDVTNPTRQPIPLDPCPGYVESAFQPDSGALSKQAYLLNCAVAPVVQARSTVRFEMHLTLPSDAVPGPIKIAWDMLPSMLAAGGVTTLN